MQQLDPQRGMDDMVKRTPGPRGPRIDLFFRPTLIVWTSGVLWMLGHDLTTGWAISSTVAGRPQWFEFTVTVLMGGVRWVVGAVVLTAVFIILSRSSQTGSAT